MLSDYVCTIAFGFGMFLVSMTSVGWRCLEFDGCVPLEARMNCSARENGVLWNGYEEDNDLS